MSELAKVLHLPSDRRVAGTGPAGVGAPRTDPVDGSAVGTGQDHGWADHVSRALAFLRRRALGDYQIDEFGFDPELTDTVLMPALRPAYRQWFRVSVHGIENVPAEGAALIVGNHAGMIGLDAAMVQLALLDEHSAHRHLRVLGGESVFDLPFVGTVARRSGATLACAEDAERLLRAGELVGAWPEGYRGTGKPYSQRYRLQRFGRGGFVSAALRTGAPIIPCSIVGSEEIYPMVGNAKVLARLLGLPFFPITPTFPWLGVLGAVPLPSKWFIEFGEPIGTAEHGDADAEDSMLVFEITDRVREAIQHNLYRLLVHRRGIFG
ncbi:MAG: lysophospholipid acyltransferase family protein [Candidatus Nanopelagicales bacterium]